MNEIAKLIKEVHTTNQYGDDVVESTAREVFVNVKSIGMKEKYQALTVGLDPELCLVLSDYLDYDDEEKVEYDGKVYTIIRTYRTGIQIELIIAREK